MIWNMHLPSVFLFFSLTSSSIAALLPRDKLTQETLHCQVGTFKPGEVFSSGVISGFNFWKTQWEGLANRPRNPTAQLLVVKAQDLGKVIYKPT